MEIWTIELGDSEADVKLGDDLNGENRRLLVCWGTVYEWETRQLVFTTR